MVRKRVLLTIGGIFILSLVLYFLLSNSQEEGAISPSFLGGKSLFAISDDGENVTTQGVALIGSPGTQDIDPYLTFDTFDGEQFSIWYENDTYTALTVAQVQEKGAGEKVWEGSSSNISFHYNGTDYNFDIVVGSDPGVETFTFKLNDSDGLEYHLQQPLDVENQTYVETVTCNATTCMNGSNVIDYRPENIIYSYAVYANNNRTNNEYGTGKAFHIYRPKLIMDNGTETWANMTIDETNNELNITVPSGYFSSADYPVIIDPTIGYTSVGASANSFGNYFRGSGKFFAGGDITDKTLDNVTFYLYSLTPSAAGVIFGIYNDSSDEPGYRISYQSSSGTVGTSDVGTWVTLDSSFTGTLDPITDYYFGWLTNISSSSDIRTSYDSLSPQKAESTGDYTRTSFPTLPTDASGYNWVTNTNRRLSIYGSYTSQPLCNNGLCKLYYDKFLEDLEICETQFDGDCTGDVGYQAKIDITEICDLTENIDNAYLELYIDYVDPTVDNDTRVYRVDDQTWDESDSAATISAQTLVNSTLDESTSTTAGTYSNITITTQVQASCDAGEDNLTIRYMDVDAHVGSVVRVYNTGLVQVGHQSFFPPIYYMRYGTKDHTTPSYTPKLYVEYSAAGVNEFIDPTVINNYTTTDWLYFNMSLIETAGSGADSLRVEIDGVNNSVCSGCPTSPPGYQNYNKTGLSDGNHTFALWINSQRYDENWAITESGTNSFTVNLTSPETDYHYPTLQTFNVTCEASAPSGIANLTLWGDFSSHKYNLESLQTYNPSGFPQNVSHNFTVSAPSKNDTYHWNCEATSRVGNSLKNETDSTIKFGAGKVYVVHAVDTETYNREEEDTKFYQNLSLENYYIVNTTDRFNTSNGVTYRSFSEDWRNNYTDSEGTPIKYTWYMMTHESHGHASNEQGNVDSPIGYNIIATIMYGNNTNYYNYEGTYEDLIDYFNDSYAWHNHHSYWNGTNDMDPSARWLGSTTSEFFFNGTELFYTNSTNETDFTRAEKLVALFAYENGLPWTSFRAGWLQTGLGEHGENYWEFLGNNTALDYTGLPLATGNFWEINRFRDSATNNRLVGFRCGVGLTQAQVNNAFAYAQNGTDVVLCQYGHNYAGQTLLNDVSSLWDLLDNASTTYGGSWEYKTDLEAAQEFHRMTDTTAPILTLSSDSNFLYVESNEELYMPPAITILIDNGETTNYTLHYPSTNGTNAWKFNYSGISMVGFRAKGTDTSFNVATALAQVNLDIIDPTEVSPDTINIDERNITVRFRMYNGGTELTSGVTLDSITVGGYSCTTIGSLSYVSGAWQQECNTSLSLTQDSYYDLYVSADHPDTPTLSETETNAIYFGPLDTCTYSGSGDWFIECSDQCFLNTPTNVGGNTIIFNGTGYAIMTQEIYNYKNIRKESPGTCYVAKINTERVYS